MLVPPPSREVVHGDALAWMRDHPALPGASYVASLPDVAELGITLERWRAIFLEAVQLVLLGTPDDGLAVFFQTDRKHEGRLVSKAGLVLRVADDLGLHVVFHKIVCRRPPGAITHGRPGFSHLLALSRDARDDITRPTPDVLPELGTMPWSHSMGTRAAELAVRSIRSLAPRSTRIVVPFCGIGTALAVANEHGFAAVGIERNRKRAEMARTFTLDAER